MKQSTVTLLVASALPGFAARIPIQTAAPSERVRHGSSTHSLHHIQLQAIRNITGGSAQKSDDRTIETPQPSQQIIDGSPKTMLRPAKLEANRNVMQKAHNSPPSAASSSCPSSFGHCYDAHPTESAIANKHSEGSLRARSKAEEEPFRTLPYRIPRNRTHLIPATTSLQARSEAEEVPDATLITDLLLIEGIEGLSVPGAPSVSSAQAKALSLEEFTRDTGCKQTDFYQPLLGTCIPCEQCRWKECQSHKPQCGPGVDLWYREHDWMIKRMLNISHAGESLDRLRDVIARAAKAKGRSSS